MSSFLEKLKEKKVLLIGGAVILVLLVIYIGLSFFFNSHFFIRSSVNGVKASLASVNTVKKRIASKADEYELTIVDEANDKTYSVSSKTLDLETSLDNNEIESLLETQNGFTWPYYIFHSKEYVSEKVVTYDEAALKEAVEKLDCVTDTDVIKTENATYSFDGDKFVIKDEVYGTEIDVDDMVEVLCTKIDSLQEEVGLKEDQCYIQPTIKKNSKKLKALVEDMNKCLDMSIEYTVGSETEKVEASEVAGWLTADENLELSFNNDAMTEFVSSMASKYNTYGKAKTLMTSWNVEVTVPGGTYGWKIDVEGEVAQLQSELLAGEDVSRDFVYQYTANSHDGNDYGNSYVEINLTAQHLYLYVDGSCVLDTDFVSGNVSKGNGTHTGAYFVMYCEKDATLNGDNYSTPVSYWMPFHGNEGMHDATWRSSFGGQIYKTSGSHGCINLPSSAAATIFSYVSDGFPVLVYELAGTENYKYEEAAAAPVIAAIDQIGTVTSDSGATIANARALYDSLTETQKLFVTNYDTLTQAETSYNQILEDAAKKAEEEAKEKEDEDDDDDNDEEDEDDDSSKSDSSDDD
ncbi:MAG: L,D-transpeptidase/peptidoglycan binding protein [Lachnospiraceae bacterium]|nr:L,D-transpeptidase/peptidoglycan binding protein [Lachnospiraceae bacterium]